MYTLEDLPSTSRWIKDLTAPEAIAQVNNLGIQPGRTLEDNRHILRTLVQQRAGGGTSGQNNSLGTLQDNQLPIPPISESIPLFQSFIDNSATSQNNLSRPLRPTSAPNMTSSLMDTPITFQNIPYTHCLQPTVSQTHVHPVASFYNYSAAPTLYTNTPSLGTTVVNSAGLNIPQSVGVYDSARWMQTGGIVAGLPVVTSSMSKPRESEGSLPRVPSDGASSFSEQLSSILRTIHQQTLETIQACNRSPNVSTNPGLGHVTSDLCKSIPQSSGTDSYHLIEMLKQVSSIVDLNLESEQKVILSVLPRTEGALRALWSEAVAKQLPWEKLKSLILENFLPVRNFRTITNELVYRIQRPNESLRDFFCDIQQTSKLLLPSLNEEQVVNIICQGMNPTTRAHLVMQSKPTTFQQLSVCLGRGFDDRTRVQKYIFPPSRTARVQA